MNYGLSCIASDISANRNVELSEDRYFKAGNIEALSKKLVESATRSLTTEEKKQQTKIIAEKYDWRKIASATLEMYTKAIGRKNINWLFTY